MRILLAFLMLFAHIIPCGAVTIVTTSATGSDDAYYDPYSTYFQNAQPDILFGFFKGDEYPDEQVNSFLRFPGIVIPKGATISDANIRFLPRYSGGNDLLVRIYLENVDNPTAPTTSALAEARSLTTGTDWQIGTGYWIAGRYYYTPNFKSEVQTVVNRSGWSSGNAILVFIKFISTLSESGSRQPYAYEGAANQRPQLTIIYSLPVTGNAMIMAGD